LIYLRNEEKKMSEIFNVGKINYEGPKSKNPLSFKYYNAEEVIGGKTMREQLRFAMSYWHTLCGDGTDMFGVGTADKSFGGTDPMDIAKKKVKQALSL
jgi:xylose isomerase